MDAAEAETEAEAGRVVMHAGWRGGAGAGRAAGEATEGAGAGRCGDDGPGAASFRAPPRGRRPSSDRRFDAEAWPGSAPERGPGSDEGAASRNRLAIAVGARMARARAARGVTQTGLARLVGVERATVCRWERGLRAPSVRALLRVAAALAVPVADLLPEGDGDHPDGA